MNSIYTSPRGFPFDSKTLKEIQDLSVPALLGLSNIIPNNCRLTGVVINAQSDPSTVTDGVIIWNGEILPFVGGEMNAQFSIIQEIEQRPFNLGTDLDPQLQDNPAYKRRWAQIGSIAGAESVHTMAVLKPAPKLLNALHQGVVFIGTITPGWNDQNGTVISISFPSLGTQNYTILSSFYRHNQSTQPAFGFDFFDKTATGFKLRLTGVESTFDYVFFEYLLIPSAAQLLGG